MYESYIKRTTREASLVFVASCIGSTTSILAELAYGQGEGAASGGMTFVEYQMAPHAVSQKSPIGSLLA